MPDPNTMRKIKAHNQNIMQTGTRKKPEKNNSCSDIYSLIYCTIPDCNDCSETMDAVRRKQEKKLVK